MLSGSLMGMLVAVTFSVLAVKRWDFVRGWSPSERRLGWFWRSGQALVTAATSVPADMLSEGYASLPNEQDWRQIKIFAPLLMMVFRPRLQLPSLLSWLLEQDAERISSASANQSAETRNAQRRSAATQHKTSRATSLCCNHRLQL